MLSGPSGLSDIRLLANRQSLEGQIRKRIADLAQARAVNPHVAWYLADATLPLSMTRVHSTCGGLLPDGTTREAENLPYVAAELDLLLRVLAPGANAVIRLGYCLLPTTIELIWIFSRLFRRILLSRPAVCNPASDVCYLVGLSMNTVQADIRDRLFLVLEARIGGLTPFEPLLDFQYLSMNNLEFDQFKREFVLPWIEQFSQHRWACVRALQTDTFEEVFASMKSFADASTGPGDEQKTAPASTCHREIQVGTARRGPPSGPNSFYTTYPKPCASSLRARTSWILAALCPEPRTTAAKSREFYFVHNDTIFDISSDDDGSEKAIRRFKRDLASWLAPGTVLEVGLLTDDMKKFRLLNVLATPEEPLRFRSAEPQDRQLVLDELASMAAFLRPNAGIELLV